MKIRYKDGGVLECSEIHFDGATIIAGDTYNVSIDEVASIEDNDAPLDEGIKDKVIEFLYSRYDGDDLEIDELLDELEGREDEDEESEDE